MGLNMRRLFPRKWRFQQHFLLGRMQSSWVRGSRKSPRSGKRNKRRPRGMHWNLYQRADQVRLAWVLAMAKQLLVWLKGSGQDSAVKDLDRRRSRTAENVGIATGATATMMTDVRGADSGADPGLRVGDRDEILDPGRTGLEACVRYERFHPLMKNWRCERENVKASIIPISIQKQMQRRFLYKRIKGP